MTLQRQSAAQPLGKSCNMALESFQGDIWTFPAVVNCLVAPSGAYRTGIARMNDPGNNQMPHSSQNLEFVLPTTRKEGSKLAQCLSRRETLATLRFTSQTVCPDVGCPWVSYVSCDFLLHQLLGQDRCGNAKGCSRLRPRCKIMRCMQCLVSRE